MEARLIWVVPWHKCFLNFLHASRNSQEDSQTQMANNNSPNQLQVKLYLNVCICVCWYDDLALKISACPKEQSYCCGKYQMDNSGFSLCFHIKNPHFNVTECNNQMNTHRYLNFCIVSFIIWIFLWHKWKSDKIPYVITANVFDLLFYYFWNLFLHLKKKCGQAEVNLWPAQKFCFYMSYLRFCGWSEIMKCSQYHSIVPWVID